MAEIVIDRILPAVSAVDQAVIAGSVLWVLKGIGGADGAFDRCVTVLRIPVPLISQPVIGFTICGNGQVQGRALQGVGVKRYAVPSVITVVSTDPSIPGQVVVSKGIIAVCVSGFTVVGSCYRKGNGQTVGGCIGNNGPFVSFVFIIILFKPPVSHSFRLAGGLGDSPEGDFVMVENTQPDVVFSLFVVVDIRFGTQGDFNRELHMKIKVLGHVRILCL